MQTPCIVLGTRVIPLNDHGPWPTLIPTDPPQRIQIKRRGSHMFVFSSLDDTPFMYQGRRATSHIISIGEALIFGNQQLLLATQAEPGVVLWQDILASDRSSLHHLGQLARLAANSAPVFIQGESGTGKELVARALHHSGPRSRRPFITLNCAALPESLAEAELFGNVRGAYTGAERGRLGAFRQADGGSLFLDEIGELPLSIQAKVLRVLESGEVRPVGSDRVEYVDVRIITASWRNLNMRTHNGAFRHDLLQRLAVLESHLLPLRNRPQDILPLIRHFLRRAERQDLIPSPEISQKLRLYTWPGNIRELRNHITRAITAADPRALLPLQDRHKEQTYNPKRLHNTLRLYDGNRTLTAQALGISRSTLYRWLSNSDAGNAYQPQSTIERSLHA